MFVQPLSRPLFACRPSLLLVSGRQRCVYSTSFHLGMGQCAPVTMSGVWRARRREHKFKFKFKLNASSAVTGDGDDPRESR